MDIQPIILAAGKGTRMGGELPKVLTRLHGRPMVNYLLQKISFLNLPHKPVVVVGYKADEVKEVLGAGYVYALQEPQLGTGHAVSVAEEHVTAPHVAVLNGDVPFVSKQSLERLFAVHLESGSVMTLATSVMPDYNEWRESFTTLGRIVRNEKGEIQLIREYKDASGDERSIMEINVGNYVFDAKWLFEQLGKLSNKNSQGEYYLTDVVALALESGRKVSTVSIDPVEALGINTPQHLEFASQLIPDTGIVFA